MCTTSLYLNKLQHTERLFVKILITPTMDLIKINTGCNATIRKGLGFLYFAIQYIFQKIKFIINNGYFNRYFKKKNCLTKFYNFHF